MITCCVSYDNSTGIGYAVPPKSVNATFKNSLIVRLSDWNGQQYQTYSTPRNIAANTDETSSTYQQDVIRSSWENVEKFPLKSGANLSMLAMYNDPVTGLPTYVPSNISLTRTRFANWQTDYFTSCNPWQQRGEEAKIPISGAIDFNNFVANSVFAGQPVSVSHSHDISKYSTAVVARDHNLVYQAIGSTPVTVVGNVPGDYSQTQMSVSGNTESASINFTPQGSVTTTVSGSGSEISGLYVSPSNFRFAMTLQHIKEMQAQIDNRYQSYIHKFFGARARDYRLDRPEFLGGSVMELNVTDINQTSETTSNSDLGEVAGKSVSASTSRKIRFHADEHCVILGTIHIIPDTEYIGGLDRVDSTKDRFDWALPQFSHLSEQAVYNKELSYQGLIGTENTNDEVFGYEPILNHLRWRKNFATGTFRDTLNSTGNYEEYKPWLIVRNFGYKIDSGSLKHVVPTLSDEFLSGRYGRDNSNFPITDDNEFKPFKVDSYFTERVVRVISSRGTVSRLGA